MTQIKAQLNGLRIAPRKVRLLAGLVRRRSVASAIDQLSTMTKRSGVPLIKLLESAVANAHSKHQIAREALFIKELRVDEGKKLKRFRPKGFGRAAPIEKKTSRIVVVLEDSHS
jgi:large subunit ribosomal protein L22